MKRYVVAMMVADFDMNEEPDSALYGAMSILKAFGTMKEAQKFIEDEVYRCYTGTGDRVIKDVVRVFKNSSTWQVTVWSDEGMARYEATPLEM